MTSPASKCANYLALTCLSLLSGCIGVDCTESNSSRVFAPGEKASAEIYIKGCGATTRDAVHVAIRQTGPFEKKDDVFVYDGDLNDVDVSWRSPTDLTISYGGGRVFQKEANVSSIHIGYRQK